MTYQEGLDYLFGLTKSGIKLGLENTTRLLTALGNPQDAIPAIHVAGTNGKGSTAVFIESILRASGFKVGLYTSPHLLDFRERIQIDRQPISENDLTKQISRIKKIALKQKIPISYFECGTALAFQHFSENNVDCNVIEVGLGGRLDSTNLCRGRVCVITSISQDHEQFLGNTLGDIALEKASIIKHPCHVVSGVKEVEAAQVIQKRSEEYSASFSQLDEDLKVHIHSHSLDGVHFDVEYGPHFYKNLRSSLLGRHQARNAALAIAAVSRYSEGDPSSINDSTIRQGIGNAYWPGRLEVVSKQPEIILDCAHNLEGIRQLMRNLEELYSDRPKRFILGFMKDKRYREMFEIVSRFAHHITLTRPKQDRSLDPAIWATEHFPENLSIEIVDNVSQALAANIKASRENELICVTGSLFTVAETKQYIEETCAQ